MRRLLLLALLTLTTLAEADFQAGLAAAQRGDDATAYREWLPLAEQGLAAAQVGLGYMYQEGKGVPQDDAEAVKWWRKAAEQGDANAQVLLGYMYREGKGVPQDYAEAVKWYRKAAEQGLVGAQYNLGQMYDNVRGVPQDDAEAVKWYRKAAEQGLARAQSNLGVMYERGEGVPQDYAEAVRWYRKAAEQGLAMAQNNLGSMYDNGWGVPQDYVQAHKWFNLAAAQGHKKASGNRKNVAERMTSQQLAEAQRLAREWAPGVSGSEGGSSAASDVTATGSGFVVSKQGHVLTSAHVVESCARLRVKQQNDSVDADEVAVDSANDLALLRTQRRIGSIAAWRSGSEVRVGESVIVVGFPLSGLLSQLNVTTGNVSALSGPRNDYRLLQITAPVQPGSSGGPVLDQKGNVVGVVVGKLDAINVARATGDIPQNVNFAIRAPIARVLLDAKNVDYETASPWRDLSTADVAAKAREFTVQVECYR